MTRYSSLLTLLAVAMLLVTTGCIYAQLLSGYSGTGPGGLTMRNDQSLRAVLGMIAIGAWAASLCLSASAFRRSNGFWRVVPTLPLIVSLGMLVIAILGKIF